MNIKRLCNSKSSVSRRLNSYWPIIIIIIPKNEIVCSLFIINIGLWCDLFGGLLKGVVGNSMNLAKNIISDVDKAFGGNKKTCQNQGQI